MHALSTSRLACAVLALTLALASAATLDAQAPSRTGIARAMDGLGLQADGEALQGAGPRYDIRFDRSGVSYLPVLGQLAPRNFPLHLRLISIRRGETELALGGLEAQPAAKELCVEFARSPSVVERYELRRDGVEQSFVFHSLPDGSGELVVRFEVSSDLVPSTLEDGALAYLAPGIGGVRVGAVVGLDAAGATSPGTARAAGNVLELALPASFVDRATFPLVLDPLLGTDFQIAFGTSNPDSEPDVAFDASNGVYLVVWRRSASTNGTAIRAQRVNADGSIAGSLLLVTASTPIQELPRVANVSQRDRFLVTWLSAASPFAERNLICRTIAAADGAFSNPVTIAATAGDESSVCLSGDSTNTDDEALVVWKDSSDMLAAQVNLPVSGDPVVGAPVVISSSPLDANPCISKSGGSSGRHVIAWTRIDTTPIVQTEIRAQAFTRNLGLIGTELSVTANAVQDLQPAVDGDGQSFALLWNSAGDIRGHMLNVSGTGMALFGREFGVEGDPGEDEAHPDVAYLGALKWCAVWDEARANLDSDVFGAILNLDGSRCGVELEFPGANRTATHVREVLPRVGSVRNSDPGSISDEALVVILEGQSLPPFEGDIVGQRIEALGPGGSVVTVSPSCGLGGNASVNGPFGLGNAGFAFTLNGASPAAASALFGLGLPGLGIPCGTCEYSQAFFYAGVPLVAGAATFPLPLSCDPFYLGLQIEVQWLVFGTTTSPCPPLSGLSASNRIVATLGQ